MSRIEELTQEFDAIVNPLETVQFKVRQRLGEWLTRATTSQTSTDRTLAECMNNAVTLAATRQLTLKHGLQLVLVDQRGNIDEPPLLRPPFEHLETDLVCKVNLTHRNFSLLSWMQRDRGMTTETAVDDGLHLLGAVAIRPDWSIVTRDPETSGIFGLPPLGVDFSAAPPFPRNLDAL